MGFYSTCFFFIVLTVTCTKMFDQKKIDEIEKGGWGMCQKTTTHQRAENSQSTPMTFLSQLSSIL